MEQTEAEFVVRIPVEELRIKLSEMEADTDTPVPEKPCGMKYIEKDISDYMTGNQPFSLADFNKDLPLFMYFKWHGTDLTPNYSNVINIFDMVGGEGSYYNFTNNLGEAIIINTPVNGSCIMDISNLTQLDTVIIVATLTGANSEYTSCKIGQYQNC